MKRQNIVVPATHDGQVCVTMVHFQPGRFGDVIRQDSYGVLRNTLLHKYKTWSMKDSRTELEVLYDFLASARMGFDCCELSRAIKILGTVKDGAMPMQSFEKLVKEVQAAHDAMPGSTSLQFALAMLETIQQEQGLSQRH